MYNLLRNKSLGDDESKTRIHQRKSSEHSSVRRDQPQRSEFVVDDKNRNALPTPIPQQKAKRESGTFFYERSVPSSGRDIPELRATNAKDTASAIHLDSGNPGRDIFESRSVKAQKTIFLDSDSSDDEDDDATLLFSSNKRTPQHGTIHDVQNEAKEQARQLQKKRLRESAVHKVETTPWRGATAGGNNRYKEQPEQPERRERQPQHDHVAQPTKISDRRIDESFSSSSTLDRDTTWTSHKQSANARAPADEKAESLLQQHARKDETARRQFLIKEQQDRAQAAQRTAQAKVTGTEKLCNVHQRPALYQPIDLTGWDSNESDNPSMIPNHERDPDHVLFKMSQSSSGSQQQLADKTGFYQNREQQARRSSFSRKTATTEAHVKEEQDRGQSDEQRQRPSLRAQQALLDQYGQDKPERGKLQLEREPVQNDESRRDQKRPKFEFEQSNTAERRHDVVKYGAEEREDARKQHREQTLGPTHALDESSRLAEYHKARAEAARKQRQMDEQDELTRRAESDKAKEQEFQRKMAEFNRRQKEIRERQAVKQREEDEKERKEEQKRAELNKRKVAPLEQLTDHERVKRRRIETLQIRNARNRQEDDEKIEVQQPPKPEEMFYPMPSTLSKDEQPMTVPSPLAPPSRAGIVDTDANTEPPERRSHGRKLGLVTFEDAQLIKWHDNKIPFDTIVKNFETRLHLKRGRETLRKRLRALEAAFKEAAVPSDLRGQLFSPQKQHVEEVLKEINDLLEPLRAAEAKPGNQQSSSQKKAPLNSIIGKPKPKPKIFTNSAAARQKASVAANAPLPFAAPVARPSLGSAQAPAPFAAPTRTCGSHWTTGPFAPTAVTQRPTTGGKTIDQNYYWSMMESRDMANQEDQVEDDQEEEGEVSDLKDFVYYVYRVYRREWTLDDIERCEYEGEEQPDWVECPGDFVVLEEANAAAAKEILQNMPGRPEIVTADGKFTIDSHVATECMRRFGYNNPEVGKLEVKVQRTLRTAEDRVPPRSKARWLKKAVFTVKQRIISQIHDEALGTVEEQEEEADVDGCIYTSPEQANEAAARRFVALTYKPTTTNLARCDLEKAELVRDLVDNAKGATVDVVNWEEGDDEDGSDKVRVWVMQKALEGPRNI